MRDVPPPKGDPNAPLKALIFDSWYDSYRGVIVLFRVIDGTIRRGMKIRFFNAGRDYQVETLGVNRPTPKPIDELGVGEVGFLTASIKTVADVQIGDTVTETARPTKEPFPGYKKTKRHSAAACPSHRAVLHTGWYRWDRVQQKPWA